MARWALLIKSNNQEGEGTQLVEEIASFLRARGIRVGGFAQRSQPTDSGHSAYEIRRVGRDGQVALGQTGGKPALPMDEYCSFAFDGQALARAREWLHEDVDAGAEVLFIDKVGKLEAAGQGHLEALLWALSLPHVTVVPCVKDSQLFNVVERMGAVDDPVAALETPDDPEARATFMETLACACRG